MLEAVLFDLGDTLVDFGAVDVPALFEEATRSTYNHLFSANRDPASSSQPPDYETYRRKHARAMRLSYLWAKLTRTELNSAGVLERVARRLNFYVDTKLMGELGWLWYQPLHRLASVKPDVRPTLEAIRAKGLKLGLISNTFIAGSIHDRHLQELGLLEFFPVRRYSCDFGRKKPDVRIFQSALKELNVAPERSMFVGDLVVTDMIGARRTGMSPVLKRVAPIDPRERKWIDHQIPSLSGLLPILNKGADRDKTP